MTRNILSLACLGLVLACNNGKDADTDTDTTPAESEVETDGMTSETDCPGVVDDCGVCDGNNADKDCAGVCFGAAVEDACGTCDEDGNNNCQTEIRLVGGGWACGSGVSCQDVFDVLLFEGAEVTLSATDVTGTSVVRFAVFQPGWPLSSQNLLVGSRKDLLCTGQNEDTVATFTAPIAGMYRVAIGRDWNASLGSAGTYELTISTPQGLPNGVTANGDNVASEALGTHCGSEYELTGGWNCATSTDCQDAYTVDFDAGSTISIAVTDVGGSSVVRHALYAPGTSLGGANLYTSTTAELQCAGQDTDYELWPVTVPSAGTYTYALTRDWDFSGGASGFYTLTVTADTFFDRPVQSLDDTASLATSAICPF